MCAKPRRIGKYSLIGKPKAISEKIALKKKMKRNALKRAKKEKKKLIDIVENVTKKTGGETLFDKEKLVKKTAKKRRQEAENLREPESPQKTRRDSIKKKKVKKNV